MLTTHERFQGRKTPKVQPAKGKSAATPAAATPAAARKTARATPPPPGFAPPAFYDLSLCPLRGVLDGVLDKWPLLVVTHLSFGTHRYNELRGALPDISQRMLTKTLKTLGDKGLVARVQHRTMPPQVDYSLTPAGESLLPLIEPLLHWGLRRQQAAPDPDTA